MRNIKEADLVVWVGPELEGFMAKPWPSILMY